MDPTPAPHHAPDTGRRHPFQVLVLIALLWIGINGITDAHEPESVAVMRPELMYLWAGTLVTSSVVVLASAFIRSNVYGLLTERAGLLAIALTCWILCGTVGLSAGWAGGGGAIVVFALIGLAAGARHRQAARTIRRTRRNLRKVANG